jgi:hypothetical protein
VGQQHAGEGNGARQVDAIEALALRVGEGEASGRSRPPIVVDGESTRGAAPVSG